MTQNVAVREIEPERFIKVTFRELPNDIVRTQYDVQEVSEDEIMLSISELATVLSAGHLTELAVRVDQLLAEKVKKLPGESNLIH